MAKLKTNGKTIDLLGFKRTGNYYGTFLTGGAQTTQSIASANSLRAFPFYLPITTSFDKIAIRVTTLATGTTPRIRLGIYEDNGNNYPGKLILDAGEVNVSSTGVKELDIDIKLPGGKLYWLVLIGQDTTSLVVAASAATNVLPILGYESDLSGTPLAGWAATQTYGVLPATYPTGSPIGWTLNVPLIALRKT